MKIVTTQHPISETFVAKTPELSPVPKEKIAKLNMRSDKGGSGGGWFISTQVISEQRAFRALSEEDAMIIAQELASKNAQAHGVLEQDSCFWVIPLVYVRGGKINPASIDNDDIVRNKFKVTVSEFHPNLLAVVGRTQVLRR